MGMLMPKKKQKKFRVDKMVREMARERIGAPASSRVILNRKEKETAREKHKTTLGEILGEE
jgi:hypothetical protein